VNQSKKINNTSGGGSYGEIEVTSQRKHCYKQRQSHWKCFLEKNDSLDQSCEVKPKVKLKFNWRGREQPVTKAG
jgi:hypothetical protein